MPWAGTVSDILRAQVMQRAHRSAAPKSSAAVCAGNLVHKPHLGGFLLNEWTKKIKLEDSLRLVML